MIERIHIENFKSIYDLDINLGRVNLFIGENGSGKSNLLEALVFVSANQSNKLDNEFLSSRGLRVTEPTLMRSAFNKENENINIEISIGQKNDLANYEFTNNNTAYSQWERVSGSDEEEVKLLILENKSENKSFIQKYLNGRYSQIGMQDFLIYSPENTALRTFEKEGQIQPLGINGEGLLKLLKVVNHYEDKSYINTIIESLQLFDWFEDIHIPDSLSYGEDKVVIKDKYLYQEIDQRSTNEGFLFILFYITLIVAKETPKAFAIDNIDASLNPKLCTKLILIINDLAKKYDKQVFLTTHNPAVLDGIDLNDEEQKLFVVSRNKLGHTRMKNITVANKPKSSNDEPLKLSEAFLRGYLGGLPKGF
ncbi:MAG: AAA family ATPase [Campylobacterota bacterium]|nr:AAA family ATPase [Campylobacterota bacterium]